MNLFHIIVLSLIEGLTEFLPISSTGHLILFSQILKIPQGDFIKTFEIVIQFGAILAVLVVYFQVLLRKKEIWKQLFVAFVPAAFLGFMLYKLIKDFLLQNSFITAISLIVGGVILIIFERFLKKSGTKKIDQLSIKQLLLIGIGQSIAIIPGISRSAASILSGMSVGLSREDAVEFSFLLAIPTIAAASLFDLVKSSILFNQQEFISLGIGICVTFVVAFLTIKFFLQFVKTNSFVPFGIYRIIAGIVFLIFIH